MNFSRPEVHPFWMFMNTEFNRLSPAFPPAADGSPVIVAGPCSAESRTQLLETARQLASAGVRYLRAGVWKPRTMPGGFEGRGDVALQWLREAENLYGVCASTEVANGQHTRKALEAGIRILWIGARTTANPFAVQEIADTISLFCNENGIAPESVALMVKNPVNPDLELWIGAITRLYNAGITRITAVHRGFSSYGLKTYRNAPNWHIPIELHRRMPSLQILCDPSHIGGKRELIAPLAQEALDLKFDGLIIESHCCPAQALSDSAQQITPEELAALIAGLTKRHNTVASEELTRLRGSLDQLDDQLIDILARRMAIAREIGAIKKANDMTVVQPQRYEQLMATRIEQARAAGLPAPFMHDIFSAIHAESVAQQARILGNNSPSQ